MMAVYILLAGKIDKMAAAHSCYMMAAAHSCYMMASLHNLNTCSVVGFYHKKILQLVGHHRMIVIDK